MVPFLFSGCRGALRAAKMVGASGGRGGSPCDFEGVYERRGFYARRSTDTSAATGGEGWEQSVCEQMKCDEFLIV